VFEIHLKEQAFSIDLLRAIDKAIPYPILHILLYEGQAKLAIAYKERNQTDVNRAVIRSYHESDWQRVEDTRINILGGLDLKTMLSNVS